MCRRFGSRLFVTFPKPFRQYLAEEALTLPEKSKQAARRLSFSFLQKYTKVSAQLIPHDSYIRLSFARAVRFGISMYYIPSSKVECLINLPCDKSVGAKSRGWQVLEDSVIVAENKVIIKDRYAKCGCGKSSKSTAKPCCVVSEYSIGHFKSSCGCAREDRGLGRRF